MTRPAAGAGGAVGAALVVAAEAAGLVGYGTYLTVVSATGAPHNRGLSFAAGGIWIAFGLLLAAAAHGLRRGRRRAASPVVLAQLIGVPVGATLLGHGAPVAGALILLGCAATLLLLFGSAQARATLRPPGG